MSQQRISDAAHISPYFHVPAQWQRVPATPGNDSRARPTQPKSSNLKKIKIERDRNARVDEEPRFNTGPRIYRGQMSSRANGRPLFRSGSQARAYEDVPNYPPPSFSEAMSTPPLSICPSTTTLVNSIADVSSRPSIQNEQWTHQVSTSQLPTSGLSTTLHQISNQTLISESGFESDSENSLEVVDKDAIPASFPSDTLASSSRIEEHGKKRIQRRGVDFPNTSQGGRGESTADDGRGRSLAHESALQKTVHGDAKIQPSQQSSSKRRYLSLSPLRTIFPSQLSDVPERPLSAGTLTPETSPYPSSRSTLSRSTGSLSASSSIFRLPLILTPTHRRTESFLTRKFFSFKGKDKEQVHKASVDEALESWEVLTADDEPRSLMSAVDAITESNTVAEGSQFADCQSSTYGTPSEDDSSIQESCYTLKEPYLCDNPLQRITDNAPETASITTINQGMPAHHRSTSPVYGKLSSQTVEQSTGREQSSDSGLLSARTQPLGLAIGRDGGDIRLRIEDVQYQRALLTPLPQTPNLTPTHRVRFDDSATATSATIAEPIPARSSPVTRRPENVGAQHSVFEHTLSLFLPEPMEPTRRHYPGRPLPLPPQSTPTSDDLSHSLSTNKSEVICPEGLLIDFDDSLGHRTDTGHINSNTNSYSFMDLPVDLTLASASSASPPTDSELPVPVAELSEFSIPLTRSPSNSSFLPLSKGFLPLAELDPLFSRFYEKRNASHQNCDVKYENTNIFKPSY